MWILSLIFSNELLAPTGALDDALHHKIINATEGNSRNANKGDKKTMQKKFQECYNAMFLKQQNATNKRRTVACV